MNKLKLFGVLLLTLILSNACTKQEFVDKEVEDSSSQKILPNTGQTISIDIQGEEPEPLLDQEEASPNVNKPRSLNLHFDTKEQRVPKVKLKEGQTVPGILVFKTDNEQDPLSFVEVNFQRKDDRTIHYSGKISLAEGLDVQGKTLSARIILGGKLDRENNRINFPSKFAEVDLSASSIDVDIDVPYASDFQVLKSTTSEVDNETIIFSGKLGEIFKLGTLVLFRLTNNMDQGVKVSGLKILSNQLCPNAYLPTERKIMNYKVKSILSGEDYENDVQYLEEAFLTPKEDGSRYENTEEAIAQYSFSSPISIASKQKANKAILACLYPKAFERRKDKTGANNDSPLWDDAHMSQLMSIYKYNTTDGSGKRGRVHFNAYGYREYAQTMVYAQGVTDLSGAEISKPNYDIVPVMGTDLRLFPHYHNLTMDCELYEQPNMLLGYFSQYPVRKVGGKFSFANSFDNASVDLLRRRELSEFVNWSTGKPATSQGVTIDGDNYYLPTVYDAIALTAEGARYYFYKEEDNPDPRYHNDVNYFSQNFDPKATEEPQIYSSYNNPVRSTTYGLGDQQGYFADAVAKDGGARVTMILFASNTFAANTFEDKRGTEPENFARTATTDQLRSPYQALYYIYPVNLKGTINDGTADYIKVQSIYLGKYYVGTYHRFSKPEFFNNERNLRNKVERYILLPGEYEYPNGDYNDNEEPDESKRQLVGTRAMYWFVHDFHRTKEKIKDPKSSRRKPTYIEVDTNGGNVGEDDIERTIGKVKRPYNYGTYSVSKKVIPNVSWSIQDHTGSSNYRKLIPPPRYEQAFRALYVVSNRYQGDKATVRELGATLPN